MQERYDEHGLVLWRCRDASDGATRLHRSGARDQLSTPLTFTSLCNCCLAGAIPGIYGKSAMHHSSVANDVRCCAMSSQALARTSAASGSTFGRTADAAAANVTTALGLLLQQKLTLPCAPNAPHPGALCYDRVFGMITTARALQVSRGQPWVIRGMPAGCDTCLRRHLTEFGPVLQCAVNSATRQICPGCQPLCWHSAACHNVHHAVASSCLAS